MHNQRLKTRGEMEKDVYSKTQWNTEIYCPKKKRTFINKITRSKNDMTPMMDR